MRERSIRPGDLLVGSRQTGLLTKQTKNYWYFLTNNQTARVSKSHLWYLIDRKEIEIQEGHFKLRRKYRKNRTLDLHGTRHVDVDEIVRKFLNFADLPCTIITGNSEKMKELVSTIVKEYDWICRDSISNSGEVIIEEE